MLGLGLLLFLPKASTHGWSLIRDTFIELFVENCSTEILIVSLMQLKQGDEESHRDFIERFKIGIITIKDLKMQEAVSYFTRKLNIRANKDIVKDLIIKSPQMLGEVYKTAQDYIFVEETLRHCILAWIKRSRVRMEMEEEDEGTIKMKKVQKREKEKLGEVETIP